MEIPLSDEAALKLWDELGERLKWRYPVEEAFRHYRLLADGEEMDLIRWRSIGGLTADET